MPNILIAKATAALAQSVASIIDCDESDATKREALAETFSEFQAYMENNGADIAKADRSGPHSLAAALLDHLHDALDRKRQRHGFEKKESSPMESIEKLKAERTEKLLTLGKNGGAVAVAKVLVADNDAHGLTEGELTAMIVEHAKRNARDGESEAQAFSRVFSGSDPDSQTLRKAINIAKAMTFEAFSVQPLQVGGEAAQDVDDPAEAVEQLRQLGRDKWPTASEASQFERALTDPANHKLARRAVPIPRATTSYPFPR